MARTPGYILKNCSLFVDRISLLGQVEEITLPVPEVMTEEIKNAGMIMPIEIAMGYTKLEAEFKMPSVDPTVLALFGLAPGVTKDFLITGALADADGGTHSVVAYIDGFIKKADLGAWKPGEKSSSGYSISVRKYLLEVDGIPLIEMSPFEVSIGGVVQNLAERVALLAV